MSVVDPAAEQSQRDRWVIGILVACTGIGILSTNLFTPSLPHLPSLLGTDGASVKLALSLNLAAYAVAQLVHGPLSDRFGRRRLLLCGLAGFCLSSLLCAAAAGIDLLLVGRVGQGIFASVASVVVILMIREYFGALRSARMMAFYGLATTAMASLGPILGGQLYVWAGWQANFLLVAALCLGVALLAWQNLPETGRPDPSALAPRRIVGGYLALLRCPAYLRQMVPLALIFGTVFAFATEGPFLLMETHGVATEAYGFYYAILVVASMLGSLLAGRLSARLRPSQVAALSPMLSALAGLTVLLPLLFGRESLLDLMLGVSLSALSVGLLLASGTLAMLDAVGETARGSASALTGSMQLAASSLASFLVAAFHDGTALPLALVILGFAALSWLARLLPARERFRA